MAADTPATSLSFSSSTNEQLQKQQQQATPAVQQQQQQAGVASPPEQGDFVAAAVVAVLDNTTTPVPTLTEWIQNPINGSITGIIRSSTKYPDGTTIMTSAVPLGAQSDTVIVSSCGNPYPLLPPLPPPPPLSSSSVSSSSNDRVIVAVFDSIIFDWQSTTNHMG